MPYQTRNIAATLGLTGPLMNHAAKLFTNLYKLFIERDCSMVEINPLVVTAKGELLALDAKFNFDDNALYRQPGIVAMRDVTEEDPREVAASEHGLNYIGLDGNIACLVNGAGLAMATMDIIQFAGGKPANFLDVGGGASKEQVAAAFRIILSDKNVEGILVNIFGGIMDCNVIAHGIVEAARETHISIPLVVRLEGNNVQAGKKTLDESGLSLIAADNILDAAQKVVAAVKNLPDMFAPVDKSNEAIPALPAGLFTTKKSRDLVFLPGCILHRSIQSLFSRNAKSFSDYGHSC